MTHFFMTQQAITTKKEHYKVFSSAGYLHKWVIKIKLFYLTIAKCTFSQL